MNQLGQLKTDGRPVSYTDFFGAFGYATDDDVYIRVFYDDEADKERFVKEYTEKNGRKPTQSYNPMSTTFNKKCKVNAFGALCEKELFALNANNYGIFWAINGGHSAKAVKTSSFPRAQFMEMDDFSFEYQMKEIESFSLPPSVIVKTKKSLHCYWLLENDADFLTWQTIQRRLIARFHSDPKISDASRVMRIPGFYHCKDKTNKVMCTLEKYAPDLKYSQAEFLKVLKPVKGETAPGTVKVYDWNDEIADDSAAPDQTGGEQYQRGCETVERVLSSYKIPYEKRPYTKTDGTEVIAYYLTDESFIPWHDQYTTPWKPGDTLIMVYKGGKIGLSGRHSHDTMPNAWRNFRSHYPVEDRRDSYIEQGYGVHKAEQKAPKMADIVDDPIELNTVDSVEEEPVEWLFFNRVPKAAINLIGGDGGTGKGFIICDAIAAITTGKASIFDEGFSVSKAFEQDLQQHKPSNVMVFSSEDSMTKVMKRRLINAGADLKRVYFLDLADKNFDRIKFGSAVLEALIDKYRPALAVFDPLQSFIPADIQMSSRNAMRQSISPLIGLGEKYGTTFIIVMHTNKKSGVSGRQRLADSSDIWDISRSVFITGFTGNGDIRYLSHEKSNYGELTETILYTIEDGRVKFQGTTSKRDRDFVHENLIGERITPALNSAKESILNYLKDGKEKSVKDLDDAVMAEGATKATLKRAKADLKNEGLISYRSEGYGNNKKFFIKRNEIKTFGFNDEIESDGEQQKMNI